MVVVGYRRERPSRFWRYVAAALDGVRPGVGQQVAPLLHGLQTPPLDEVVTVVSTI